MSEVHPKAYPLVSSSSSHAPAAGPGLLPLLTRQPLS